MVSPLCQYSTYIYLCQFSIYSVNKTICWNCMLWKVTSIACLFILFLSQSLSVSLLSFSLSPSPQQPFSCSISFICLVVSVYKFMTEESCNKMWVCNDQYYYYLVFGCQAMLHGTNPKNYIVVFIFYFLSIGPEKYFKLKATSVSRIWSRSLNFLVSLYWMKFKLVTNIMCC